MHGVTLLPEKFTAAQEGAGSLFPANDVAPLIIELRQIAPRMDYILIVIAEQRLGGRAHAHTLLQLVIPSVCHPCDLRSKALYMLLLLIKKRLGNKERHVNILMSCRLKARIKNLLNILPDSVSVGTIDHAALNACISDEIRLCANVGIPLCEIIAHGCYLLNELFLFCHSPNLYYTIIIFVSIT